MKLFCCSVLFVLLLPLARVHAADTSGFASVSAKIAEIAKNPDFVVFDRSFTAPGERPKTADSPEQLRWDFTALANLLRAGDDFLARFPEHPHRWFVALRMNGVFANQTARLITDADRAAVAGLFDEKALAAREASLAQLRADIVASPGPTVAEKLQLELAPLARYRVLGSRLKTRFAEWPTWRAELDRLAIAYPNEDVLISQYDLYLRARRSIDPAGTLAAVRAEWAGLAASPNRATAAASEGKVRALDLEIAKEKGLQAAPPFELAFTAADGREVDLAKLRGKVVLVDFWATWCGPCIAELPNVKKIHAEYHAQGFEVVGVALENAKLSPADTPEQRAAKLAKAKDVLLAFTAKQEMPWPQYFDGKWWKNDVAARYAIDSIPAMFLLDRDGKVVSTNARGEKLGEAVRQLLQR